LVPACIESLDEVTCATKTSSIFTANGTCGDKVPCPGDSSKPFGFNMPLINDYTKKFSARIFSEAVPVPFHGRLWEAPTTEGKFILKLVRAGSSNPNRPPPKFSTVEGVPKDYIKLHAYTNNKPAGNPSSYSLRPGVLMHNADKTIKFYTDRGFTSFSEYSLGDSFYESGPQLMLPFTMRSAERDYAKLIVQDNLNTYPLLYFNHGTVDATQGNYSKLDTNYNKISFLFDQTDHLGRGGRVYQAGFYDTGSAVIAEDKSYQLTHQATQGLDRGRSLSKIIIPNPLSLNPTKLNHDVLENESPFGLINTSTTYLQILSEYYSFYDHTRALSRYNKVNSLRNITDIKNGLHSTCAISSDGNVFCWGNPTVGGDSFSSAIENNITTYNNAELGSYIYCQTSANCLGENLETTEDCIDIDCASFGFLVWRQNDKLSIIFGRDFRPGGGNNGTPKTSTGEESYNYTIAKLNSWKNGDVKFDRNSTYITPEATCFLKESKTATQSGRKFHVLNFASNSNYSQKSTKGGLVVGEIESPAEGVNIKKALTIILPGAATGSSGYSANGTVTAYLILWSDGTLNYLTFDETTDPSPTSRNNSYEGKLAGLDSSTALLSFSNVQDIFKIPDLTKGVPLEKGFGFVKKLDPSDPYNCVIYISDKRDLRIVDSKNPLSGEEIKDQFGGREAIGIIDFQKSCTLGQDVVSIDYKYPPNKNYGFFEIKLSDVTAVDSSVSEPNNTQDVNNSQQEGVQILLIESKNKSCFSSSENVLNGNIIYELSSQGFTKVGFGNIVHNIDMWSSTYDSLMFVSPNGDLFRQVFRSSYNSQTSNFTPPIYRKVEYPSEFTFENPVMNFENCSDVFCEISKDDFKKCNVETGECQDCRDSEGNFVCDFKNVFPISHLVGTCAEEPCPVIEPGCCCATWNDPVNITNQVIIQNSVADRSQCAPIGENIIAPDGQTIPDTDLTYTFTKYDGTFNEDKCVGNNVDQELLCGDLVGSEYFEVVPGGMGNCKGQIFPEFPFANETVCFDSTGCGSSIDIRQRRARLRFKVRKKVPGVRATVFVGVVGGFFVCGYENLPNSQKIRISSRIISNTFEADEDEKELEVLYFVGDPAQTLPDLKDVPLTDVFTDVSTYFYFGFSAQDIIDSQPLHTWYQ